MPNKQVQLKVVEALQDDAYKGIARIDSEIMKELEIRRGDVILIKRKQRNSCNCRQGLSCRCWRRNNKNRWNIKKKCKNRNRRSCENFKSRY